MPVSREKLYRQVWAAPMIKLAARHGVSSTFLARICQRMNVPVPGRGYWAKHAVGKAPAVLALPDARPGDLMQWRRGGERADAPTLPKVLQAAVEPRRRRGAERPKQHELVVGAREHFLAGRVTRAGYLRPYKKRLVDLFVSDIELDRALAVASELFLALEDHGHRVRFAPEGDIQYRRHEVDERDGGGTDRYHSDEGWRPSRPTLVFVGAVAFGLTLFEISEEVEVRMVGGRLIRAADVPADLRSPHASFDWTAQRHMPTGRLCVRVSSPYWAASWEKQWTEKVAGDLPKMFNTIARTLESEAATLVRLVAEGEREEEVQRQKQQEEETRRRREEAERRRRVNVEQARVDLFAVIAAWDEARRIHDFFDDAERRLAEIPEPRASALREQLQQARALIGDLDGLAMLDAWIPPQRRT